MNLGNLAKLLTITIIKIIITNTCITYYGQFNLHINPISQALLSHLTDEERGTETINNLALKAT